MFFAFDGKNSIYQDLISQLPEGKVYFKEDNIMPYADVVTLVEQFDTNVYPVGTPVNIYINNVLHGVANINTSKSIYYKMKTPYGKFKVKLVVNSEPYAEGVFYALNILTFFNALSKTYNYDYFELFKMFGNIWDKHLQDDMLYSKIGWFYDFPLPYGWTVEDYRKILIGSTNTTQINHLFLNAMTYWSMSELIKAFTGETPLIFSYRDEQGWILGDDTIPINTRFKNYYLVKEWTYLGAGDIAGFDMDGYQLILQLDGTEYTVNFTTTTGGTDIALQINTAIVVSGFIATVETVGSSEYIKLSYDFPTGQVMIIKNCSAIEPLGFSIYHFQQDEFVDSANDIITIYDETLLWNAIDIVVRNGTKTITETVTRSESSQDKLRHKYVIDTPSHPLSITGYTPSVDYELIEDPIGSNEYYINWLTPSYYMQGANDITGVNLIGQTLILYVDNIKISMMFNNTPTPTDIVNQINTKLGGVYASVVTVGPANYIRIDGSALKVESGTAATTIGFTFGQTAGIPVKNDQFVVIYSYFMREEIINLAELNKPCFLKITYYFIE